MKGFLLIDKPDGPTSHDVVNCVRRITGEKRVGHAGTLDPFATGLLIVAVGREATRELQHFVGLDKTYEAVFAFGAKSDTDDRTGKIQGLKGRMGLKGLRREEIEKVMRTFVGTIKQVPPQYAAIKIKGKKMYELARAGKTIEAKPREVTIHRFEILAPFPQKETSMLHAPCFMLRVLIECSSGTYIRALARDLGEALGTGGYVQKLRRTRIGPFSIEQATPLNQLLSDSSPTLLPIDRLLDTLKSTRNN